MIQETRTCAHCGSTRLVRNGSNQVGNAPYNCRACGRGGVLISRRPSAAVREQAVTLASERVSLRGIGRTLSVSASSGSRWVKKSRELARCGDDRARPAARRCPRTR